jgi:hypothetical protein
MMPFSTPQADPNKLIELRVLTIIAGEKKTSQKGKPYWLVKDSGGTEYAVFRSNIAERLDSATDPVPCAVEISVKGQYTNYAIVETDGAAQLMASAPSPVGAPQTAQNSLPTAQQGQGSPTPHFEQDRNESIRAQTTLKAAAEMYAACLGANKALKAILDGKNELDVALDIGKKAGMVAEADPELPGPDAPADEENPDGFPF